jgi:hypothetical protein
MAGQLKVGGNIIASHSGVEGAGEVTLQNVTLGDSGVVFPAGHVIQTVQHVFTGIADISSVSTDSFASFSVPFSKGITPFLSTSKILVSVNISLGHENGSIHTAIYRDGNKLTGASGDLVGNRIASTTCSRYTNPAYTYGCNSMSFNYLDTPTIPSTPIEIVYEIKATLGRTYNDGIYLNYSAGDGVNMDYTPRTASFMTLFEIAQ